MSVRQNRVKLTTFLVTIGVLSIGTLLTSAVEGFVGELLGSGWSAGSFLIAALLLCAPFYLLFNEGVKRAGRHLGSTVKKSNPEQEKPRRYLLMGYSPMGQEKVDQALMDAERIPVEVTASLTEEYQEKLSKLPLPAAVPYSWQQNVRAAYFHREALEKIFVLRPDQNDQAFRDFKKYLESNFRDFGVSVEQICEEGCPERQFQVLGDAFGYSKPNYEDYEYVYEGLTRGLEMIDEVRGQSEAGHYEDVCVDVTPGTKPFSIGAAILTLNQNLKFSYVTTNGALRFYDASIDLSGA